MTHHLPLETTHTQESLVMADQSPIGKIPLTLQLPAELAARLKTAAETQRRSAAGLATDLLDRYLPKPPSAGAKKGNIPYS
jgi:hypothetical protein